MSLMFVDSSCELGLSEIKKLGIECIEIPYTYNGEEIEFDENFDYDKYYSKLKKGVEYTPKSLTKEDYINAFDSVLSGGDDIVYVYSSGRICEKSSLESAKNDLLEKYPDRRLELIDSCNIGLGYGLVAYNLALMYRQGATIQEIIEKSYSLKNEFATLFIVDSTLKLIERGLLGKSSVAGMALNIKPIISIDVDGGMQIVDKVSGRKSAISKFVDIIRQQGKNVADFQIGIMYSGVGTDAKQLEEKLIEVLGNDIKLIVSKLSPNTTSLTGLGTLGIVFHVHRKIN